ncbi:MAG: HNH endonuclease signature motif containing protein [Nocardioidaceae bacterium]
MFEYDGVMVNAMCAGLSTEVGARLRALPCSLDDADSCARELTRARDDVLEAEARKLVLVAHWVDLHPSPEEGPGPGYAGRATSVEAGGDGTPAVHEFAAAELGVLLGVSTASARWVMADAVNLRHRHPLLWAEILAGRVPSWAGSKTARMCAHLSRRCALAVDAATAAYAHTLPIGRYLPLVEAAIIDADPPTAQQRADDAARARFVQAGRANDHGIATLTARVEAGQLVYLMAVITRIAQILGARGDQDSLDVRRAKALVILANPAAAVVLLAASERFGEGVPVYPDGDPAEAPAPDVSSGQTNDPGLNQAIAEVVLRAVAGDLDLLRPAATVYLHISHRDFVRENPDAGYPPGWDPLTRGTRGSVVRMERAGPVPGGPITVGQAQQFLGHCRVTIKPVLDLADQRSVDAYEVPDRIREQIMLRRGFETFPYGTLPSRRADIDHIQPYRPPADGGEAGQTRPGNLTPLGRSHHRIKTHGDWRHLTHEDGTELWRTPTGYWTQVDQHGTHRLGHEVQVG